jgi:hypothetical protein
MLTHQALWAKACKSYGQYIPERTFRDWIGYCYLSAKAIYDPIEVYWVLELAKIARRYPKGSRSIRRQLHQLMESQNQNVDI